MQVYLFGVLGGLIGTLSLVPQFVKSWRTKKTRDVALATYLLLMGNNIMWFMHGAFNKDYVLCLANAVASIFVVGIIISKVRYS